MSDQMLYQLDALALGASNLVYVSRADGSADGSASLTAVAAIIDGVNGALYAPASHTQAWSTITGTPTTLAGYGVTDALTQTTADARYLRISNNLSEVTAATARTNLGLGTAATSAASSFLAVANNLSDLNNAATARTNLGVAIGTNVQAWDADLDALAALSGTDTIYRRSGAATWSAVTIGSGLSFSGGTLAATGVAGGAITGSGLTMTTARLLGRTTASTGAIEELTAGTGLVLSAGSLAVDTGTSGAKVALTNGANTWSSAQTDSALATFSAGANLTPAATPATNAVGYLGAPQNTQNGAYTTVMADAGKHLYHTSATAHTWTIDSNANVAYPIGTVLTFVNESGGGNVTLAITSDTLRWTSSTGSRTLAANGTATALKVASTTWRLTGDGIT